jgi:hypothetical protein
MSQRRIIQVDANTGETIENGFIAYVAPKQKNGFGTGWLAMAQDVLMIFAKSNLGADDFKVLMALLAKLDFENLLVINQAEIARELGIQRQTVQRSIKRLMAIEALLEGPRIGVSRSYRLNPNFGWKGSARSHQRALEERMKATGIKVIQGKKK